MRGLQSVLVVAVAVLACCQDTPLPSTESPDDAASTDTPTTTPPSEVTADGPIFSTTDTPTMTPATTIPPTTASTYIPSTNAATTTALVIVTDPSTPQTSPVADVKTPSAKAPSDGSTTTVLLSIAIGLAAAVGGVLFLVSRRRQNHYDGGLSTSKDMTAFHEAAARPVVRLHRDDPAESEYSVEGLMHTTDPIDPRRVLESTRSSNILDSMRAAHALRPTCESLEEGESFVDEHYLNAHATTIMEDEPIDEDAILCSMTSDFVYLESTHSPKQTTHVLRESDTYIVGDNEDDSEDEEDDSRGGSYEM
ncbi:Aste57867_14449 [Aphanomyces stellatus]|uniref:Aste57867_14449 protein n=1 Tax=Aphanomyces stellatus TaxID=120398 RepID=A0A485L0N1_9STRA|nr:hypothetical protein As57867_014395 [Aphanomyces stellatus]VFT91271.1 Aste57867_14449 [Aphanomyces stellatus]